MNWSEIVAALGALKYLGAALDAAYGTFEAMLPQDKADIQSAAGAIQKALTDLKSGIVAMVAAVQAAEKQA